MKTKEFESVRNAIIEGSTKTFFIINKTYRQAIAFDPFIPNDSIWDRQFPELKDGLIIDGKYHKPVSIKGEAKHVGEAVEKGNILEIETEI